MAQEHDEEGIMRFLLTSAGMSVPAYAIDDQTAIQVVDGTVDVVSEGHWQLFAP